MTTNTKEIGMTLIQKAFDLYPEWNEPLNLTKPTVSPKLANVNIASKQMAQTPFDEITRSVLCGTILGDTSFTIDKNYANARFQSRHSTRQLTWFCWKYFVILKKFTNKSSIVFTKPDGLASPLRSPPCPQRSEMLGKLKIASKACQELTELHKIICVKNRKTVERSWLNHMNNYFLMTVWLDDGSLGNGRQGTLSFNSMPLDQQQIFRDYLLSVWGIETKFQETGLTMKNGHKSYRIAIRDQDNLLKLLRLIAPVIPVKEMLYKVCFLPDGNLSLLQRWKSELKNLVRPEFVSEIDKIYDAQAVEG